LRKKIRSEYLLDMHHLKKIKMKIQLQTQLIRI
jgi:hypothetical protein